MSEKPPPTQLYSFQCIDKRSPKSRSTKCKHLLPNSPTRDQIKGAPGSWAKVNELQLLWQDANEHVSQA